jgi:hypothetical protein
LDARVTGRADRNDDARQRAGLDADTRGRLDSRVAGRLDGRADGRVDRDGRFEGRGDGRFAADWVSSQARANVRNVRSSLASAFQRDFDRDGRNTDRDGRGRDGRDWDRDGRNWDRDGRDWDDWRRRHPHRAQHWNRWGNFVRAGYFWGPRYPYYTSRWWQGRPLIGLGLGNFTIGFGNNWWWGYQPWNRVYPYGYWWNRPVWNSFYTWFPNCTWTSPYYYDYGYGGNVVYRDTGVFVSGQYVGTPAEYAASAAELAYVDPSTIEPTPAEEWKPLGTFSVAISEDEQNPSRVIQLAVNRDGLISGTIYNRNSDKLYTVQGRVDEASQRVAFTIGNDPNVVLETGLYNLTLDETPVLVHFGENQTQTYLFVRLEEPTEGEVAERSIGVEALR